MTRVTATMRRKKLRMASVRIIDCLLGSGGPALALQLTLEPLDLGVVLGVGPGNVDGGEDEREDDHGDAHRDGERGGALADLLVDEVLRGRGDDDVAVVAGE